MNDAVHAERLAQIHVFFLVKIAAPTEQNQLPVLAFTHKVLILQQLL